MITLTPQSEAKLEHVHPDLIRVVRAVARNWPDDGTSFRITCGARTVEEQKRMVETGASKTMRSRHIIAPNGYSHAVDFCVVIDGTVRWDWPLYEQGAERFKKAAAAEKVSIEWGGDWTSFKDGPHIQLPWDKYPGNLQTAEAETEASETNDNQEQGQVANA